MENEPEIGRESIDPYFYYTKFNAVHIVTNVAARLQSYHTEKSSLRHH